MIRFYIIGFKRKLSDRFGRIYTFDARIKYERFDEIREWQEI